jgi:hypothetical protein
MQPVAQNIHRAAFIALDNLEATHFFINGSQQAVNIEVSLFFEK